MTTTTTLRAGTGNCIDPMGWGEDDMTTHTTLRAGAGWGIDPNG